jgi:hypothetical protein
LRIVLLTGALLVRYVRAVKAQAVTGGGSPGHGILRYGWYPSFVDYLHLSFSTSMAFSPTDVSAIKPWAKLMMMAEETISVVVGILVVARAVNILK